MLGGPQIPKQSVGDCAISDRLLASARPSSGMDRTPFRMPERIPETCNNNGSPSAPVQYVARPVPFPRPMRRKANNPLLLGRREIGRRYAPGKEQEARTGGMVWIFFANLDVKSE
jgi:hypothetical protein